MTGADQKVDSAADKLEGFVAQARRSGGVKAKLGEALAEDPEFLRKLKPSLIVARAKGQAPTDEPAGSPAPPRTSVTPRSAPSAPQIARPEKKSGADGPSPWAVVGIALAGGYLLAKVLDWRGHAHPRV